MFPKIRFNAFSLIGLFLLHLLLLTSCRDDSLKDDINEIKKRVTTLEDAVANLSMAFDAGKTISDVRTADNDKGWTIDFTDGTSITLNHGENGQNGTDGTDGTDGINGITPLIVIDDNGHWSVSYDGGYTFAKILDASGNAISPYGSRGSDGADGKDGVDGVDGRNGLCVRISINSDGYYVFETYDPDNPDINVESITTPYSSEPGALISSIVKDSFNNVITLTLAGGETFCFNLDVSYPTSIVALSDSILLHPGKSFVIQFRVNPSISKIDLNVDCDNPQIQLDLINSRSSYVTTPANYRIVSVDYSFSPDGSVKIGQYVATITDLNITEEYDEDVVLGCEFSRRERNTAPAFIVTDKSQGFAFTTSTNRYNRGRYPG